MAAIFHLSAILALLACINLSHFTGVKGIKCYHDDWLAHKKNELKECEQPSEEGTLLFCEIKLRYNADEKHKGCMTGWEHHWEPYCMTSFCQCAEDGCNKDWKTCLASVNGTDEPHCQLKQPS